MPEDDSLMYLGTKGKLETFSAGAKRNATHPKYPNTVSIEAIDAQIATLTKARSEFTEAESLYKQKSAIYKDELKNSDKLFSEVSTQIYGSFGKQNPLVIEFGLKTYQKPGGRKGKTNPPAS